MESFICLLCPAVVALLIYEKKQKSTFDCKKALCAYLVFVLFVNTFATFLCRFIFGIEDSFSYALDNSPIFAIKYVFVALVFAIILSTVAAWLSKNVRVELIARKEKKDEKHKKNPKNK